MNPSAQRIRRLFQDNNPTDPYWLNFQRFLLGHSYKDRAALLNNNPWERDQVRAMLAMIHGISAKEWFATSPEIRPNLVLRCASSRPDFHRMGIFKDAPTMLDVLGQCWDDCPGWNKMSIWGQWDSGLAGLDPTGRQFMLDCMQRWHPASSKEMELKIQALVGTFDALSSSHSWTGDSTEAARHWVVHYSRILHAAVLSWRCDHGITLGSVHTWRQLQAYPDFLEHAEHPHPWMESLCVAYSAVLIPNLPPGVVFHEEHGQWKTTRVERGPNDNPTNPNDRLLAQALHNHYSRKPIHPAPEIEGLYGLLDGMPNLLNVLLTLTANPSHTAQEFEVEPGLFDAVG